MSSRPALARTMGALTVAYSVAVLASPKIFAKPCGLLARDGSVPADVQPLIRSIAARDTVVGLAMTLAPAGTALRLAAALRAVSDLGDAGILGSALPDREARGKVIAVSSGWAAVCSVAAWLA
jgi:hypothetical protein